MNNEVHIRYEYPTAPSPMVGGLSCNEIFFNYSCLRLN